MYKITDIEQEMGRTKNKSFRNPGVDRAPFRRLSVQNHTKQPGKIGSEICSRSFKKQKKLLSGRLLKGKGAG